MTDKTKVLIFTSGSSEMKHGEEDDSPVQLAKSTVFSGNLFLSEADALACFDCETEYLTGTSSAVVLPSFVESMAEGMLDSMTTLAEK